MTMTKIAMVAEIANLGARPVPIQTTKSGAIATFGMPLNAISRT